MVVETCTNWYNMQTNEIQPITSAVKDQMNAAITKMAESSLRTLCVAYKKLSAHEDL